MLFHSLKRELPIIIVLQSWSFLVRNGFAREINLGNIQSGSLAGAAHLLKDNAGVQRLTHLG
jgi:hypothetical protein